MARPVIALVAARARRRGSTTVLSILAIGMAAALVAIVAGSGLIAADATLQRALTVDGEPRPVMRASDFSSSGRDADVTESLASDAFRPVVPFSTGLVRGVLYHQLRDQQTQVVDLVAAVDQPAPWVELLDGRMPAPCLDGVTCEALLLAAEAPSVDFEVAVPAPGMTLTIVGRGLLDPAVPFGDLDQRGPFGSEPAGGQYQTERTSPAVLLLDGVDALTTSPALETVGRTYVWTAPLDVEGLHPWTAGAYREALLETVTLLSGSGTGYTMTHPGGLVRDELERAEAATGRLLLIGSLGIAILLAFAVFLALVVRDDVGAEVRRLAAVGARRRDRALFLVLDAAVPATIGGVLGWLAGGVVVGVLAATSGVDPAAVIAGTLAAPGVVLAMLGVLLTAIVAIVLATAPGLRLGGPARIAAAVSATAVIILAWQLLAGGSLGAAALARSLVSPVVVLLPPVLAFLLAIGLVALLPPILRAAARRARGAALPIRLSLLSVSREPTRPAATLTLLAFSLGAMVFAAGWSASLRQGIDDAAAYRSGLDLRVTELGTALSISPSVVPVDRYASLGDDVRLVPVVRDSATNHPGGRVEIIGMAPEALPTLPGWRSDFSGAAIDDLARALVLPAPTGGWVHAGHRLDPADRDLELHFTYAGQILRLDAVIRLDDGDSVLVRMGDISDGMETVRAPLPESARGGLLTALVFRNPGLLAGSGHQDVLRRATVSVEGIPGLTDDSPRPLEIFQTSTEIITAPQVTDGLAIPAIVSPVLAATASADGRLDLGIANEAVIPLQVVGVAERMPTVTDAQPRFIVVPSDPYLIALAAVVPGAGRPTEMWIGVPDAGREADVRAAIAEDTFRFPVITSRSELVAERSQDPISRAIVWTLVIAAVAGLALSIGGLLLGAVTDLRDERGELADLEAQGVTPGTLRAMIVAKTAWLTIGGTVAGLAVGLVLTYVVTSALAITAEGTEPVPPLVVVIPVGTVALIVGGVLVTVLGIAAVLATRTYGRATLGERRGPRGIAEPAGAWAGDAEAVDG